MVTSSHPYPFPSIPDALARKTPVMLSLVRRRQENTSLTILHPADLDMQIEL